VVQVVDSAVLLFKVRGSFLIHRGQAADPAPDSGPALKNGGRRYMPFFLPPLPLGRGGQALAIQG